MCNLGDIAPVSKDIDSFSVMDRKVYLRGLIEISNICRKNCLYCGIRCGNCAVQRYELSDEQILEEAQFALDSGYGSVVLQGGERADSAYIERISRLVAQIKRLVPRNGKFSSLQPLGITLSLGEQCREVYKEWYKAGAHRYLLRIEASNRQLYEQIHPHKTEQEKAMHSYDTRLQALYDLKSLGYITGSGVMIGLPFQTGENLEEDLRFFREFGVNMVGMGPYIPHKDTPLGHIVLQEKEKKERGEAYKDLGEFAFIDNLQKLELSIDMVRRLRKQMPHINIAATTALQVLDPDGREMAVLAGANVIMPNVTETGVRVNYRLYEGKPGVKDDAVSTKIHLEKKLADLGVKIGWWEVGDPHCL